VAEQLGWSEHQDEGHGTAAPLRLKGVGARAVRAGWPSLDGSPVLRAVASSLQPEGNRLWRLASASEIGAFDVRLALPKRFHRINSHTAFSPAADKMYCDHTVV
jgi:hypothetical protein